MLRLGIMAGPLYWKGNMPPLNDRTTYIGYENACDFLAGVDAMLLPSELEGGPIVLLEAWAMRVPFFMRLTGLAVSHAEAVQIIGTNAADTAQQIVDFMRPENEATKEEFLDRGTRVLNQKYTTEVVHKQWVRVIEEALERKRMHDRVWRAPLFPMRMPGNSIDYLLDDNFQVDRLGRAAVIDCYSGDRCAANITVQIPSPHELPFIPHYLVLEYHALSPETRLSSAGILTTTSSSPQSSSSLRQKPSFRHTMDFPISSESANSHIICFQLPPSTPSTVNLKFSLKKTVHVKVIDISVMESAKSETCIELEKHPVTQEEEDGEWAWDRKTVQEKIGEDDRNWRKKT